MADAAKKPARKRNAASKPKAEPFVPTDEERMTVSIMCAASIPLEKICLCIRDGISVDVLRSAFEAEIATSAIKADAKVMGAVYNAALKGNVAAQKIWSERPAAQESKAVAKLPADKGGKLARKMLIARRVLEIYGDREGDYFKRVVAEFGPPRDPRTGRNLDAEQLLAWAAGVYRNDEAREVTSSRIVAELESMAFAELTDNFGPTDKLKALEMLARTTDVFSQVVSKQIHEHRVTRIERVIIDPMQERHHAGSNSRIIDAADGGECPDGDNPGIRPALN